MTKKEWTTEEVLQNITKQLENKEKNTDLLRTRIRSKIRRIKKLCASNKKLHEENQNLKELLKEWVQFEIEENPNDFTVISERMSGLANKTKQAIGENK